MIEKNIKNDKLYESNDWETLTDRIGVTYLALSAVNFIFSFVISILCVIRLTPLYIIGTIVSVALMVLTVYFYIRKKDIIRIISLIFIILGFVWILMSLEVFPSDITLAIIMSFVEIGMLVTNYYMSRYLERA